MTKRREYTAEFKIEAIKLVKETGQPKIARDLGMSGDLLSRWVRKYNESNRQITSKQCKMLCRKMAFKPNLDEGFRLKNFKQTIEL